MAHELEEERRRDSFYNIDPNLSDEDYFKELGAKDEALVRLTARLQTQSNLATVLGSGTGAKTDGAAVQVTYLNSDNNDHAEVSRASAALGRSTWRPRFYIEVSSAGRSSEEADDSGSRESSTCGAIGEATFERSQDEWVPTSLSIVAISRQRHLVDVSLPLPHGLKYVSLRSLTCS